MRDIERESKAESMMCAGITPQEDNSREEKWEIVASDEFLVPKIQFFDDLIIDIEGVEYKGERIEDAGKVYRALREMLIDHGYRV